MTTETAKTSKPSIAIVDQVREAFKKQNRLATGAGFVLGGFIPVASFILAHFEVRPDAPLYLQVPSLLVLAGLVYSAKTVFDWARLAFRHPAKALGFVVLTEGVMTFAHTPGLYYSALTLLVVINGVATGCNLALDSKEAAATKRASRKTSK